MTTPPGLSDPQAERGLLAALQRDPALVWRLGDILQPYMFHEGRGQVYTELANAAQQDQTPPHLMDDDPAEDPIAAAGRVRDMYAVGMLDANLQSLASDIGRVAAGKVPLAGVLTRFEEITAAARNVQNTAAAGLLPAGDLLGSVIADVQRRVDHRAATGSTIMGLPTGFKQLDELLNGLEPGLLVLAGKPGMGKTTLANLIAGNVAGSGVPVLYVTYENSRENLILKHLCRLSREAETDARRGEASPQRLAEAARQFAPAAALLYYVEAAAQTTIETIQAQALQIKRRHNAESVLVIVDYLQKAAHTAGYDELRANVGAIAAQLRDLSRTLSSPVLALASMNRDAYKNKESKPSMAQLKESGDIEYGADVVLLLSEGKQDGPPLGGAKPVDLWIDKNRGGASDTGVSLVFKPAIGDFKEQAPASMAGSNGRY
jgi:replicative DNA helicase